MSDDASGRWEFVQENEWTPGNAGRENPPGGVSDDLDTPRTTEQMEWIRGGEVRDSPREYVRRFVCWLLGHSPVGPPYYSPMCARCGLLLRSDATPWGQENDWAFEAELSVPSREEEK